MSEVTSTQVCSLLEHRWLVFLQLVLAQYARESFVTGASYLRYAMAGKVQAAAGNKAAGTLRPPILCSKMLLSRCTTSKPRILTARRRSSC